MVVMGEAIGFKKGPKAPKKRLKAPNGAKGPLKTSAGARIRGA